MVTIGNRTLPGTIIEQTSESSVALSRASPGRGALVGEANLVNGTAEAAEVYAITSPVQARQRFGRNSPLTLNVIDALSEGAYPIYAAAWGNATVDGEAADDGVFDNAPVTEALDGVTFSGGDGAADGDGGAGTAEGQVKVYGTPNYSNTEDGVVPYNPITGEYDTGDITGATVTYTHAQPQAAIEEVEDERGDDIDFFAAVTEDNSTVRAVHSAVKRMEQHVEFALAIGSPDTLIEEDEFGDLEPEFDSSRMQQVYPSRAADGQSVIGAYVGMRAALGIDNSPISSRLGTQNDLIQSLSIPQQEDLVGAHIAPLADEKAGARLVDDPTMVSDDNLDEAQMAQSLQRLVVDYATNIVNDVSNDYVGEFNKRSTRTAMKGVIASRMRRLMDSNSVETFTLHVAEVDAMTARVELGIDTVDPLRNIEVNIAAGEIQDPTDQAVSARGYEEQGSGPTFA